MTKNQFRFDRDTVATNLKTPIVYDEERMSIGEVLDKLNELSEENEQLKQRIKVLEDSVDGLAGTIAHFDLDEVMWND